jgi:hypothetical protein
VNAERLVALARDLNTAHAPKMGTLVAGTGILCRYARRYQTTPPMMKRWSGRTLNLKPSSGNGDRNVTALQVSSAGGNSSPGDASQRRPG